MNPLMNMLGPMMQNGAGGPMQMLQMLMGGQGNPMQMIQQMAQGNPQMQQVLNSIQGKGPDQLREMAENLAKERGTSIEEVAKKFGMNMPK